MISPFTTIAELCKNTLEYGNEITYDYDKMVVDNWNIEDKISLLEETSGVMIMHGDRDFIVPYKFGVKLSKLIKGCQFVTLNILDIR